MRDLSKIPLSHIKRKKSKAKRLAKLLVLLVLILATASLLKSKLNLGSWSQSSVVLREAARGLTPVELSGGEEELTAGAVDLVTQRAILVDVKYGGKARAVVTRSYGGGLYILSVTATLPDPKNVSYQVWVVGGGEVIPIDYMSGSGTTWSLDLRSSDQYSNYDGIWITLERSKDEIAEEHVMEGSF